MSDIHFCKNTHMIFHCQNLNLRSDVARAITDAKNSVWRLALWQMTSSLFLMCEYTYIRSHLSQPPFEDRWWETRQSAYSHSTTFSSCLSHFTIYRIYMYISQWEITGTMSPCPQASQTSSIHLETQSFKNSMSGCEALQSCRGLTKEYKAVSQTSGWSGFKFT